MAKSFKVHLFALKYMIHAYVAFTQLIKLIQFELILVGIMCITVIPRGLSQDQGHLVLGHVQAH